MRFSNRELYMLLGAIAVVALAAAFLAPRELKPATPPDPAARVATAEPPATAGPSAPPAPPARSSNRRYSSTPWAPVRKPRPDDPTPY
jgi:hypothetical protein